MTHPVVAVARGWLGTRFHHQGRLKRTATHAGGVDCLGLLVGVASELNLHTRQGMALARFDERDYSRHPDSQKLQTRLSALLTVIPAAQMQAGDVALMRIDDNPQHLAIISENEGIIHAYAPARGVVEHALDDWWRDAIVFIYRI